MLKLMLGIRRGRLGASRVVGEKKRRNGENSVHGWTQTRHSRSKTVHKIRRRWIKPRQICDIYGRSCQNTTLIVADKVGTVWPVAAHL